MSNITEEQNDQSPLKMTEVKEEPTSIPDVIDIADDSDADDSSSDSSDDTSDSSTSDRETFVDNVKKMLFEKEFTKEMFMDNMERIYESMRNKKGKKSKDRKKKKRRKDRKLHFKKVDNKSDSANKPKLKMEPLEESKNVIKLPVWHEPASFPLEKPNSANESVQLSIVKDEVVDPHCNIEASLIENADSIKNSGSLRRYDDLDNGDLDYFEETMDFEVDRWQLDTQSSDELDSQDSMNRNDYSSRSIAPTTIQLTAQTNDRNEIVQWIKYEPECNIIDDDELIYRSSNNSSNVHLPETIKPETINTGSKPVEVDPKTANSGLDHVALNENVTINTGLTVSETTVIKQEPIKEEPMTDNSESDVITLSDEDEDDKERITDVSCKTKIKNEQTEDNRGKVLDDCNDFTTDSVPSDSSDDDMDFHESLRDMSLEETRRLSNRKEEAGGKLGDDHFEEDSQDTLVKGISEDSCFSSDDSNNAGRNTISEQKPRIKREQSDSDEEEIETMDEESVCKEFSESRISEGRSGNKLQSTVCKNRDEKKLRNKTKSPDRKRSHDEIASRCAKKSCDKKRSSNETKSCDKEISWGMKRSIDEEPPHCNKKPRYEKTSCDEKRERRRLKEEKKCHKEQRSEDKKRSHEQKRSDEKRAHEQKRSDEKRSHEQKKSDEKRSHEQKVSKEKIFQRVKEELSDRDAESEDDALMKFQHKVKNHKHDAVKRRRSSEAKSARISDSNHDDSNEDSNRAESSVNSRPMPNGFPLVVLTKLNHPIKSPSPVESPVHATDERNIKRMYNSIQKQEASIAFTSSLESLECNEREIPLTKKPKIAAYKSTTKRNSDFTLKSKTETKHRRKKDNQPLKSIDGASLRRKEATRLEGEALKETVKKIAEKAKKKILSECKSAMEILGARLEVKMTVEAGSHFLIEEQESQFSKRSNESVRMSPVNEQYEEYENVGECSRGKKQKSKSVDQVKETVVDREASSALREKTSKGKTEKSETSNIHSKEGSTDGKTSPTNRNNSSKINAETRKSLYLARETLPKAGTSAEEDGNSVGKKSPTETNFSLYTERKSVTSFVGKIPKKSATQRAAANIPTTPNYNENNLAGSSDTHAERSPTDEQGRSKKIWSSVVNMVEGGRMKSASRASRNHWVINNAVDTKACPKLEQFLLRIFQWNPAWLKEKMQNNTFQKVVDKEHLARLRPTYETYEDYYSDAERILAMEVWLAMTSKREMKAMKKKRSIKFSIVSRSVNIAKVPSTNIEMTTLLLDVVISNEEALVQAHPIVGDLVFFEYFSIWQGKGSHTGTEVFAYVTHVRSNVITPNTRFNRHLQQDLDNPHTLLTYTVITKPIHHSEVQTNRVGEMTTVPYFRPNSRKILALQHLPDSPLLNMIIHPKVEDYQLLPARNLENYPLITQDNLNARQLEAVSRITDTVVKREPKICLIEGPPGTGKTKVITNLVTQIIHGGGRYKKKPPFRILVCAPSNVAVDEIVMRLLEHRRMFERGQRFRMVRVGRHNKMPANVMEVSLSELANKEVNRMIDTWNNCTPEKIHADKAFYEKEITELEYARTEAIGADARKQIARKIEDIRTKYDLLVNPRMAGRMNQKQTRALLKAAENTILEGAHVIVCTLVSCCTSYMEAIFAHGESNAISVCIVDEGTKNSEAETLLPLLLGVKTLVLVGDCVAGHQPRKSNLPDKSKFDGLEQSLFARVQQAFAGQAFNPTIHFDTQYRMSHPVALWPNEHFYNGAIISVANLSPLPLPSYKVINLNSTPDDVGRPATTNNCEAYFVACIVYTIMTRADLDHLEMPIRVGVITPPINQASLIEKRIEDRIGKLSPKKRDKIIVDVNTIDGLQGQERDVVIMSCVRSGGLLADRQKLCQALTRARHSLIICGNFESFRDNCMWEQLLSDAKFRGVYADARWDASADEVKTYVVR